MNEFLREYYNNITFCVEILAAVTGLLLYKKYKQTAAKYFIWFLVYLSICDFLGIYVYYIKDGFLSFLEDTVLIRNFWWSTLFWKIGAIVFFGFYYRIILINENFKSIIKYSTTFFFFFSVLYIIINWEDYFTQFFLILDILGSLIIFLCTVFYFFEILQSDNILTFYKLLNFYISTAIFIWWLIITPLVFYDIYNSNYDWNFIFLKWQIYLFANIFMYSTFTFALIFCKPENMRSTGN
jgi:hypothetical protein